MWRSEKIAELALYHLDLGSRDRAQSAMLHGMPLYQLSRLASPFLVLKATLLQSRPLARFPANFLLRPELFADREGSKQCY